MYGWGMDLFGKRQAPVPAPPLASETAEAALRNLVAAVTNLTNRVGAAESLVRTLETEQLAMHDQVRKWMRRAVAAERVATVAAGGQRVAPGGMDAPARPTPKLPEKPANMRGALGRIYVRKLEEALAGAAVPATEPEPGAVPGERTVNGSDTDFRLDTQGA